MKFRFLTSAEAEMMEAAAYYEMQVEKLGINFLDIADKNIILNRLKEQEEVRKFFSI